MKFSKPATDDGATLNGRPVRPGDQRGAPGVRRGAGVGRLRGAHTSSTSGSHTLFVGEVVDAAVNDDEARPASMNDTRMKYGGVQAPLTGPAARVVRGR